MKITCKDCQNHGNCRFEASVKKNVDVRHCIELKPTATFYAAEIGKAMRVAGASLAKAIQ